MLGQRQSRRAGPYASPPMTLAVERLHRDRRRRSPLLAVDAGAGRRPDRVGRGVRRAAARGVGAAVAVGRERDRAAGGGRRRPAGPGDDGGAARRHAPTDGLRPGRPPPPHGHPPPSTASTTASRSTPSPTCWPRCSTQPDRPLRDWPSVVGDAPPEVLVCGHGRRDPCCGRWGTLLHAELAAREPRRARVAVQPHRRAPLRPHRHHAPRRAGLGLRRRRRSSRACSPAPATCAALAAHDRGCTALDPWAQVVERALFVEHGWAWLDGEVDDARTEVADDGRSAAVELRVAPRRRHRRARPRRGRRSTRILPVLVCGEPPEVGQEDQPRAGAAPPRATPRVRGA